MLAGEKPRRIRARRRNYHTDIARGVCTKCRRQAPVDGKRMCDGCRAVVAAYRAKYRARSVDAGECYDCPSRPLPGRRRCAACLAIVRERVIRSRAKGRPSEVLAAEECPWLA